MPKVKQETGPSETQLKGEDGVCETVVVDGVRVNKHEHDEEEHGAAKPDKLSPVPPAAPRSKRAKSASQDFDEMTVEELHKYLDREGIEYKSDDLKDDLVKAAKKGK